MKMKISVCNLFGRSMSHRAVIPIVLAVAVIGWGNWAQMLAADITNIFYGSGAGASVTTGDADSGFGYNALHLDTTGFDNTATGVSALVTCNYNRSGRRFDKLTLRVA